MNSESPDIANITHALSTFCNSTHQNDLFSSRYHSQRYQLKKKSALCPKIACVVFPLESNSRDPLPKIPSWTQICNLMWIQIKMQWSFKMGAHQRCSITIVNLFSLLFMTPLLKCLFVMDKDHAGKQALFTWPRDVVHIWTDPKWVLFPQLRIPFFNDEIHDNG